MWRERGWGRGGEETGVDQQMVMDGDWAHFLCSEVSRCCVGSGDATVQSAGSEGKCEALSPVCPAGRRVCDDRTPAVSPEPSSQRPGSYCFSPFGCPAKGMKHRQITSLETQQSLHLHFTLPYNNPMSVPFSELEQTCSVLPFG